MIYVIILISDIIMQIMVIFNYLFLYINFKQINTIYKFKHVKNCPIMF